VAVEMVELITIYHKQVEQILVAVVVVVVLLVDNLVVQVLL
jgi:hypothetical protein